MASTSSYGGASLRVMKALYPFSGRNGQELAAWKLRTSGGHVPMHRSSRCPR
jgi:hypothetical protein